MKLRLLLSVLLLNGTLAHAACLLTQAGAANYRSLDLVGCSNSAHYCVQGIGQGGKDLRDELAAKACTADGRGCYLEGPHFNASTYANEDGSIWQMEIRRGPTVLAVCGP